jgi:hypothetical protein
MHFAVAISVGVSVIAAYLALLATWSLSHDETLTRSGRVARVVLAWLVPIIGPMFLLRSAAELAPESLPAPAFTWPVRWLWASGRPVRGDTGPDDSGFIALGYADGKEQSDGHK